MGEDRDARVREENRKIRFLRMLVDLHLSILKSGEVSYEEAKETVERLKELAEKLFPGKGYVFDIVYRPRFERVIVQIYRHRLQ